MNVTVVFRRLVYAQVILGMIAFAAAEQSIAMMLIAGTFALLSWYIVEGPRGRALPRWLINLGVVCVLVWLARELVLNRRPPLLALGQFILAIQIFKLFERKENRDYAQLIVLSLLQMICACIISVTVIFGAMLLTYLVLTLFTILLFQIKLSHDEVHKTNRRYAPDDQYVPRPRPVVSPHYRRQFNLLTVLVGVACLCLAAVVFVLIPRGTGRGVLGDWQQTQASQAVSGYRSDVQLGSISRITTSPIPVLNVSVWQGDRNVGSGEDSFRLRGNALDHYESSSRRWQRSRRMDNLDRKVEVPATQGANLLIPPPSAAALRQQITLRANTRGALFGLYPPTHLAGDELAEVIFNPHDQVLRIDRRSTDGFQYEVTSLRNPRPDLTDRYIEHLDRFRRRPTPAALLDRVHREYAVGQVINDPRLADYTRNVLAGQEVDPASVATAAGQRRIADAVAAHLQQNFSYTLSPPATASGTDPIVDFLFNHQRGHCEYFASAMAAMLRSVGMRARLISGLVASEFNAVGGYYIVRQKNAHAWVEVHIEGVGWDTYDPSPTDVIESHHQPPSGIVAALRNLYDYVEFKWIDSVITFNEAQRKQVVGTQYQRAVGQGRAMLNRIRRWFENVRTDAVFGSIGPVVLIVFVGAIVLGIGLLIHIVIHQRNRVRRLHLESASRSDQRRLVRRLEFYLQALRLLAAAGHNKPVWQPPAQFADNLAATDPQRFAPMVALTDVFYEIRFGGRPLDDQRAAAIDGHLRSLRTALKRR